MNPEFVNLFIAAILVIAAITLVAWFRRHKGSRSEWRMASMLKKAGVDPETIDSADHAAVIKAIRSRCRRCQKEDVCERWLAGNFNGEANFCPNEAVIKALAKQA